MWFLSGVVAEDRVWTDRGRDIWLRQGKEMKAAENPRRRKAEAEGTVTDAVNSPPPSRSETPVIMWI